MPRGDRTGPWGAGPITGSGRGYCAGNPGPGFMYPGPSLGLGRGFGRGFGRGMGYGRGFGWGMGFGRGRGWRGVGFGPYWDYPPMMLYGPGYWPEHPESGPTKEYAEEEKHFLKEQINYLEEELAHVKQRLEELKKQKKTQS